MSKSWLLDSVVCIAIFQGGRKPAIRCEREKITSLGRKQKFAMSPLHAVLAKSAVQYFCLAKSQSIG